MWLTTIFCVLIPLLVIEKSNGITSPIQPFTSYRYSTELQNNVADLWWTVDETKQEITFELHVKTLGWIALGISPAGGMKGADIGLGWIDQSGQVHFQDRHAYNNSRPVVDTTTTDWFALQGREQNGWTAIQFKRLLDTCDTMDVPIKSGTNILIFAYGLEDPDMSTPNGMIYYHDNRRGSRIIPLRSYGNPSPDEKFAELDYFDFQLKDYVVPSTDTTYHCKIYKIPEHMKQRRHAVAHKTIIDSANVDIVHHLLMYECNPTAKFDDNNLPDGECDQIYRQVQECSANIATGWAVGGDRIVEFPEIAGYPVGGDFEIKYYMVQMHYDNPKKMSNRRDSSGIRFYLGKELREQELGYLTLGADSSAVGIAIPPGADRFIIDSYCPASATNRFPKSGITVTTAFPHTHLQGASVWTKIIRDKKAVDYLFNGESYDFNFQFENRLPKPVQLYPGDEFATRCVYNTMNKDEITLGGERTKDEMCLHMFTYYPRMNNFYGCMNTNSQNAWKQAMNVTEPVEDYMKFQQWLRDLKWTPESINKWQEFYDNAPRLLIAGGAGNFTYEELPRLPEYIDLKPQECKKTISSKGIHETSFISLTIISFLMTFITNFFIIQ
ncbi:unnamed protein product [Adineta steineri]|uniref:DOMON domain-containing protein n=1 Tax=Adineta steineri TaxID=433720 RepID=A0A814GIU7_9BILA|nr:unnamed protein product [Adineta steineri]CAF3881304.1 unnamed protein product [Adineta steineri]